MSEVDQASKEHRPGSTKKRNLVLVGTLIPLAAFFAILAWGVARSGGNPGGFGINSAFSDTRLAQRPAPAFEGTTLEGTTLTLEEMKGKVVMVDFWSSWCPPCKQEAPGLAQVYQEYQDRGVEFVGVAIWDRRSSVEDFVQEEGVPYPNIIDDRGEIAIDYGVSGIPEKYFINRDGQMVRKFVGPTQPEDLRQALNALLGS